MDKQVVETLKRISTLLELTGGNSFKIRAYRNAVRVLEKEARELKEIIEREELISIKGIGKGIAEQIIEIVRTGKNTLLKQLQEEVPEGLVELLEIPGLGAKKLRTLWQKLNVQEMSDLEWACENNLVAGLPGFGEKTQTNILSGIQFLRRNTGLFPHHKALREATEVINYMKRHSEVQQIELAGSLRRGKELVKDVDIVVASQNAKEVMNIFVSLENVSEVIAHGETKSAIRTHNDLQIDLRVVEPREFCYALMHFTGSKEHNTAMRARAKKRGLKLNEYGIFQGEDHVACQSEKQIFAKLDLPYIIPELREDWGEIENAEQDKLPDSIKLEDITGLFHTHTVYSDGVESIENMALAVKKRGYHYLGITDHSQSLTIANGMSPETLLQQIAEIDELNKRLAPFRIFKGIESDILNDGSLDYAPEILAQLDFVIASIHGNFRMPLKQMTERVVKAVENPFTTMIGHPSGRLLLRRKPINIDMHAVIDAAAEHNVILEINTHPLRLDLDWRMGKYAWEKGIITSLNPDAHTIDGLDTLQYGITIARKAWFAPEKILNSYPLEKVEKYFAERKARFS